MGIRFYGEFVKLRTKFAGGFWLVLLLIAAGCAGSDPSAEPVAEPTTEATAGPTSEATAVPASEAEPAPTPVPTQPPVPTLPPLPTLPPVDPVVFADDFGDSVAPIFADKCASCHNAGGPGSIHWQLDDAADLVATHEWIATVVNSQYMPPWPASDLSPVFHENRSLRPDQIQAISDWSTAGAPLDIDETTPIIASRGIAALDADVEIAPNEPFRGSTDVVDEYRCLVYDLGLSEPKWLQAFEFVPDQTQIVHHAVGFLAPASARASADALANRDELGGWQCYGGSGIRQGDELFLGWAPGQLPTRFPEGSGMLAEPGDFIIMQIHYHFDTEAPADASSIRLEWADGTDLDPIQFDEFLGPAEIPCSTEETGPLCDRDAARARAYSLYGIEGVLADSINSFCGVRPDDFAEMTSGIATSACKLPVRNYGEIVSVFGHEHEIGKSFRMTLNPGRPDERILLDIPDWSFDWQYNYYPVESIMLAPGDIVQLECAWDRARRAPDLEPAYVLWADGTNDEMCFATIATRWTGEIASTATDQLALDIPEEIAQCLRDAGLPIELAPSRELIDATIDELFECAEPSAIGDALTAVIADNFGGLIGDDGLACLSERFSEKENARNLLIFGLADSTPDERRPTGEVVGDCVLLSDAIAEFGFPLPEAAKSCVDEAGRLLLVQATVSLEIPEEITVFGVINDCVAEG